MKNSTTNYWWLGIINGLIFIFLGWFLLTNTSLTTLMLMQILGIYWLLTGVIDIISSVFSQSVEYRGWKLASGILGVLAGLIVINSPVLATVFTAAIVVYIIAFTFIFNGIARVFLGRKVQGGKFQWSFGSLLLGIVFILIGFLVLTNTAMSALVLLRTIGLLAITGGLISIATALVFKGETA